MLVSLCASRSPSALAAGVKASRKFRFRAK
jgi:hypothetical protein